MRPLVTTLAAGLLALTLSACAERAGAPPEAPSAPVSSAPPAPSPEAGPDTSAVALRRASSAEILGHVRKAGAPVVIVNFWATWCVPCIQEFPDLVRAGRELKAEGADLVFVSVDAPSERPAVLAFLARRGATGPAFLKDEADEPFMTAFSPAAADWDGTLPATFLYDAKGRRLALFEGATTHAALTDTVRALLSTL